MKAQKRPTKTRPAADYGQRMEQVRAFADRCRYEQDHCEQTARLAVELFEAVRKPLGFNAHDRFLLESGAVLHDIGWMQGEKGHHKASMKMILADSSMPLDSAERIQVALIARYHRRALPQPDHLVFQERPAEVQQKIRLLAGLLRIADGLDRSHMNAVETVEAVLREDSFTILCQTKGAGLAEIRAAEKKSDLLVQSLNRPVHIRNHRG